MNFQAGKNVTALPFLTKLWVQWYMMIFFVRTQEHRIEKIWIEIRIPGIKKYSEKTSEGGEIVNPGLNPLIEHCRIRKR